MTMRQIHVEFVKDNLACIATGENDVKNGNEVEDGDGDKLCSQGYL